MSETRIYYCSTTQHRNYPSYRERECQVTWSKSGFFGCIPENRKKNTLIPELFLRAVMQFATHKDKTEKIKQMNTISFQNKKVRDVTLIRFSFKIQDIYVCVLFTYHFIASSEILKSLFLFWALQQQNLKCDGSSFIT